MEGPELKERSARTPFEGPGGWQSVYVCWASASLPAHILNPELEVRQKREQIPAATLVLAVEDPETPVGSGGATLNALLVAAEHLSARAGFTVSAMGPGFMSELAWLWLHLYKLIHLIQEPQLCLGCP